MNFSNRSKHIESECKAYAYRSKVQSSLKSAKFERAALTEIEQFPVGSDEWKAAVKRNIAIFENN